MILGVLFCAAYVAGFIQLGMYEEPIENDADNE